MGAFNGTYRWLSFLMSLVFHIYSNCSGSLHVKILLHKCPVMLSIKRLLPSSTSNSNRAGMLTSTISISIGISLTLTSVGKINSIMPLNLMSMSPNWKSRSGSIMGMELRPARWTILLSVWLPNTRDRRSSDDAEQYRVLSMHSLYWDRYEHEGYFIVIRCSILFAYINKCFKPLLFHVVVEIF